MLDKKMYRETFSALHASKETLMEVYKVTNNRKSFPLRGKHIAMVAIAAALILALSVTALAYAGVIGWFSPHRDEETSAKADTAQSTVNEFANAAAGKADEQPPETDSPGAAGWARYLLGSDGRIDLAMADYASEDDDGNIIYYFTPGTNAEDAGDICVRVSAEGSVYSIDCRAAFPYPAAEDAPEQYFCETCDIVDGAFVPSGKLGFLADQYLTEIAYPNGDAYRSKAEPAAISAMELLHQNGFITESGEDVDLAYFRLFNGGAAWVCVLTESGSVYDIWLQPDELSILGYFYHSPEDAANSADYPRLFEAIRTGTLDEYHAKLREEFKAGVG